MSETTSTPTTATKRAASPLSPEAGATHKRAREDGDGAEAADDSDAVKPEEGSEVKGEHSNGGSGEQTMSDGQDAEGWVCVSRHYAVYSADGNSDAGPSSLSAPPASVPAAPVKAAEQPVQQIAMRCLIVTQDASIIIGRQGAHVNEIRVGRLAKPYLTL